MKNRKKTGIVLVHFGTTYDEARANTMDVLEAEVREQFPEAEVLTAFTSNIVRKRLKNRGIDYPDLPEALSALKKQGMETVILLLSLLLEGQEYEKVLSQAKEFEEAFSMSISPPLLREESLEDVAELLQEIYPLQEGEQIVFMGHGSRYPSDALYRALEKVLQKKGYTAYIATLEGKEGIDDLLPALTQHRDSRLLLAPFLYVAGDHAHHDMVENDDSWKKILEDKGYQVEAKCIGLGEFQEVRAWYRRKLSELLS
ncbi:MAG TPA: hypothetical protein GX733_07345 [Tissierellia bacterium]|nr:hypothetical protein [Tissierellia bacterium]